MAVRLPSSADVETVSPRVTSDPGVSAPAQAFESELGVAVQELEPVSKKLQQVALRQENRRDTVNRADKNNTLNRELEQKLRELNTEKDLSQEKVQEEFTEFASQRRQELMRVHQDDDRGSEDSKAQLATRMLNIQASWEGRAAAISTTIGRAKLDETFENALSPLVTEAAQDPTVETINRLFSENLPEVIADIRGGLDPTEERSFDAIARERIALSALNIRIARGDIETAATLLDEGGLGRHLAPDTRLDIRRRIETNQLSRDALSTKLSTAQALRKSEGLPPLSADDISQVIDAELGISREPPVAAAKTKEVFNRSTGQLQFATETQIGADPNLVPSEVGAVAKPAVIKPSERLAASFALRTEQANEVIDEVGSQFTGVESRVGELLPQGLKSEDRQLFEQAERNFVNAILRRESGAAIAPSEFISAEQQYFPRPGDSEAVLDQKRQNRIGVSTALQLEAGEAFTQLKASIPSGSINVRGNNLLVGSIVTNKKGQRGRVEQDGTITVLAD